MQIQLIRNATLRMEYAHRRFIIDPYLAAKHTRPSYTGASPNPLVDLPCSPQEVIAGIEMALISHLHSDHFDPAAKELLPKAIPILCQPDDAAEIESMGFRSVIPVEDTRRLAGDQDHPDPLPTRHGRCLGGDGGRLRLCFRGRERADRLLGRRYDLVRRCCRDDSPDAAGCHHHPFLWRHVG